MNLEFKLSEREEDVFQTIGKVAESLSLPAFVIGGFVRDKLMGRPTKDIDIVCLGDGIALANGVAQTLKPRPKVNVFKTFGTAQIKWDGLEIEFVGARKESYVKDSRKPLVMSGTLEEDQNRRDFTINALAFNLDKANRQLIDPFDGLSDLKRGIIRTPLDPSTTFSDDPLRMMRAIRFAAQLGFEIDRSCFRGIREQAHRLKIVSKERIADELNKIIMTPKPSIGFELLYDAGLLELILPQLTALSGTEYVDNKGHKDNFYHSLKVLDNIAPNTDNVWLRWAALLHDIGKAVTKKYEPGHGWTFHGHEIVSAKMVPKIFRDLRLPMADAMPYVRKIIGLHHRPISLTKENITDSAIRRLLFDAGEDIDDLMTLCKADITSKNRDKVIRYTANFDLVRERLVEVEEKDKIRNWQPPISGDEIMKTFGLSPSRIVGVIKTAIREAILDGVIANDYEAAHGFMVDKAAELGLTPKS